MDSIKIISAMLILAVITSLTLWFYIRIPIVVKSYSTGECLAVLSDSKEFGCDNMPNRYVLEWAE